TLTKIEIINPHGWIYVDVKNPDGSITNWAVEAGSANTLQARSSQDEFPGRFRGCHQRLPREERTTRRQRADSDVSGRARLLPGQLRHAGRSSESVVQAPQHEETRYSSDRRG